ncbi:hypothetical protein AC1031_016716 [Aphanomyces cochlioides]|nr:hypothetical protein AC1031_016716 [Aphanomyces cochlioides]
MLARLLIGGAAGIFGLVSYIVMSLSTPPLNCPIECECKKVHCKIAAPSVLHIECYCDDCQALDAKLRAKFPHSKSGLNASGGTTIVTMFPSDVSITTGHDKLAQGKIKQGSTTRRVYSSCCGTHLFNVTEQAIPFIAVVDSAIPDKSLDSVGPAQCHIATKFATAPIPGGSGKPGSSSFSLKMMARTIFHADKTPLPVDLTQPAPLL